MRTLLDECFDDYDNFKGFDVQACKVGDFVFRSCLPEKGLLMRVLKPAPLPTMMEYYTPTQDVIEMPYMEFEASLAQYERTVIRTWRRIY